MALSLLSSSLKKKLKRDTVGIDCSVVNRAEQFFAISVEQIDSQISIPKRFLPGFTRSI